MTGVPMENVVVEYIIRIGTKVRLLICGPISCGHSVQYISSRIEKKQKKTEGNNNVPINSYVALYLLLTYLIQLNSSYGKYK